MSLTQEDLEAEFYFQLNVSRGWGGLGVGGGLSATLLVTQSVVPGPAASAPPANLLK